MAVELDAADADVGEHEIEIGDAHLARDFVARAVEEFPDRLRDEIVEFRFVDQLLVMFARKEDRGVDRGGEMRIEADDYFIVREPAEFFQQLFEIGMAAHFQHRELFL